MTDRSASAAATPAKTSLQKKNRALEARLRELAPVAVAFSGGVDSSLLYAVARRVLGDDACAVLGLSPAVAETEREWARRVAAECGGELLEIETTELEREGYRANAGDRCFYCKDELYSRIGSHPRLEGWSVCDGTHAEDPADDRPGMRAAEERGVHSPLRDVGLTKAEIRALAQEYRLENWDRPARPCLSSRVVTGTEVSAETLHGIERLEAILERAGFRVYRARVDKDDVIVTVAPDELERFAEAEWRTRFVEEANRLGFRRVLADLRGYRAPGEKS